MKRWAFSSITNSRLSLHEANFHDPLRWRSGETIYCNEDLFHQEMPLDTIDELLYIAQRAAQHEYRLLTSNPDRLVEYYSSSLLRAGLMVRNKHVRWGFFARTNPSCMASVVSVLKTGLGNVWFDVSGSREFLPLGRVLPHDFSVDPKKPGYCEDCGMQRRSGRHSADAKPRVQWFTVSGGPFVGAMIAQIERGGAQMLPEAN